jgi:aspartyl-tRNA(Asn)/glutamyl-tRNA(Gln) amidotransferase subunit B
MVREGTVSASAAKTVFSRMRADRRSPREIVATEGLTQMSDAASLGKLLDDVIERHPKQVAQVRAGEEKVLGFLVGQAMKASGGTANPALARRLLAERIAEQSG